MFGFKKNEKPTLIIEAKDLMEIIKSDYDNDTQGAMSGENSNSERRIHIRDEKTGEEHSLKYWGTGSDLGDKITVRYLPHTEYGYVVE